MRPFQRPAAALYAAEQQSYDANGLREMLREARESGASDMHFKVPTNPRFRIKGTLLPTRHPPLKPEDTHRIAQLILKLAGREEPLATLTDLQVGFGVAREGRFRAHIYRQRGSLGVVIHRMALDPPRLEELGAPPDTAAAAWEGPGLVLVPGSTNRLALLAALVHAFNQDRPGHLLCLEYPLEYLHRDARAAIAQREVGVDVPDFAHGLRAVLVDDSDAVMLTDLPDVVTAELALRVAEAGRPVVAGLSGCGPEEACRWLIRMFPPHREREISERLERVMRRVIWQTEGRIRHAMPHRGVVE